jgi:alpha-tubulin suppressor-like RCC1 family protein
VRVGNIAAASWRSYAVTETGELWAWGCDSQFLSPLGHDEKMNGPVPKRIQSLRGVKVDAVATSSHHTLALADDGSVFAWGNRDAAKFGALGLGSSVEQAQRTVPAPQRLPALLWRVCCDGFRVRHSSRCVFARACVCVHSGARSDW